MNKVASYITVAALIVAVLAIVVVVAVNREPVHKIYAEGALIDANEETGILREEDGDPAELANRLITLANGGSFTAQQINQIAILTTGMFEELRGMGMDIERLQRQVKRLEAAQGGEEK